MQLKKYNACKYIALALLPIVSIGCSSGNSSSGGNNGPVSLGTLPTGQSVMLSSGILNVNASQSGSVAGSLSVPGLTGDESVTFVLTNSQEIPSLSFESKNSLSTNVANKSNNNSKYSPEVRCTVTAYSSYCFITSNAGGAYNGSYQSSLYYEMKGATGKLNPVQYKVTGGLPPLPTVPGTISMSLSAESLDVGTTITATYKLTGASGLNSGVVVTANSSNKEVLKAYNDVNECTLTLNKPTCTISESGLSAGTAIISSKASGYTIPDSNTITVVQPPTPVPPPVPGTISMNLSAESVFIGGKVTLTYTLNGSESITTPVVVLADPVDDNVLGSSQPSCELTTANPSCTVTESALAPGGTVIRSVATGYSIPDSKVIAVNNTLAYILSNGLPENQYKMTYCEVNSVNGQFSNCSVESIIEVKDYTQPPRTMTINGNLAFIVFTAESVIRACQISESNGRLNNCQVVESSIASPKEITINESYAYVTNSLGNDPDLAPGAGYVYVCNVNHQTGELSNCTTTGGDILPYFSFPSNVAIAESFAYLSTSSGTITSCNIDPNNGTLSNCNATDAPPMFGSLYAKINIHNNRVYYNSGSSLDDEVTACNLDTANGTIPNNGCQVVFPGNPELWNSFGVVFNAEFAYIGNVRDKIQKCTALPNGTFSDCSSLDGGNPFSLTGNARSLAFKTF